MKPIKTLDEALQSIHKLQAILDVSKAMGSEITIDNLLKLILDKTTEVMDADRSSLFIYDEKTNELWSKIAQGLVSSEIRFPVGIGVAGDVAKTLKTENIPDAYLDKRFNPGIDKLNNYRTKSLLCMPLLGDKGQLVGVIQVLNKKTADAFDEEDEAILEALSSHISVALQRAQLIEHYVENQLLAESLQHARKIQLGMLPTTFPPFPDIIDIVDVYAILDAAKFVGGDLYDFFLLDDNYLCIIVGDVSGKGIPAAVFMAMAKTLFKAVAKATMHPEDILMQVNNLLVGNNEELMFLTLFFGMLNLATGVFEYGSAGHNPPYIIHPDGTITNLTFESPCIPLAIQADFVFNSKTIQCYPGDFIYLYTDGVNEATDSKDELYSNERLEVFLKGKSFTTAKELVLGSLKEVKDFVKEAPQSDDITILAVKYGGARK